MSQPHLAWCAWARLDGADSEWRRLVEHEDEIDCERAAFEHAEREGREYVVLPRGLKPKGDGK